jgi:hypothetical protein
MILSYRPTGIPFLLLAIVLGCLTALPAPVAAGELRMGVAAVKINPTIGTPMDGGFGETDCRGVLDDLFAKATVLDDGKTKVAMVVCDVCALTRPVVDAARRLIAEKTGIPAANAMISATHNHTGPRVVGDSVAEDALVTGGNKLNAEYSLHLSKWIAEAVEEAQKRLTPARVSYGHEDESKVSYIRRFWMRDGSVGWNPGSLNPNILRPIGQIDPQVNVIYAETAEKKPLLTYVNFPLHACTTAGSLASADFPGALARCLAFCKGPDMLTIFAQGACGNVNHLNVRWNQGQFSPAEAKRIGTILAGSVCKAYMDMKDVGDCTLRVRREMVSLDLGTYTEEDLHEAREILARRGANAPFLQQVKACKVVDIAASRGKPIDAEIQVFALGRDIAWVSSPGELFVELGMSMKAGSRFSQTNVVELASGPMYYIPNCSAYSEGQYEVVSTHYAAGSGERLVTVALRLLAELHQEAVKP